MSNKKPSRRAEKPRLGHWRHEEEARTLGGVPPKGLLSPCCGVCCRALTEFLSFSFSGFSAVFLSEVEVFFKCLGCSPIYRPLVAFRRAFMTLMAIKQHEYMSYRIEFLIS